MRRTSQQQTEQRQNEDGGDDEPDRGVLVASMSSISVESHRRSVLPCQGGREDERKRRCLRISIRNLVGLCDSVSIVWYEYCLT